MGIWSIAALAESNQLFPSEGLCQSYRNELSQLRMPQHQTHNPREQNQFDKGANYGVSKPFFLAEDGYTDVECWM
jgi:hypothetical protein